MADQASAVSSRAGDEYQTLKMFYRETGLGMPLQHLSSSGSAEAIQLRNVVDLAVQVLQRQAQPRSYVEHVEGSVLI